MQVFEKTIDGGAGGRRLRAYLPDATERSFYRGRRPAVVIFPGGAYAFTFEGEAEPIALSFTAAGVCAFVLDYTTTSCGAPQAYPYALREAFAAIRFARENAAEFGIDPHNVASLGFSAGGHLCASTGTLWNKPLMADELGPDARASRPDKLILCYPVIRAFPPCHSGSYVNLLGKEAARNEETLRQFSLERQVDDETPPAYLWTTAEDTSVPIQGALEFAHALADHRIHQELHIYPHGGHGSCLGNHVTEQRAFADPMTSADWIGGAIRFLFDANVTQKV